MIPVFIKWGVNALFMKIQYIYIVHSAQARIYCNSLFSSLEDSKRTAEMDPKELTRMVPELSGMSNEERRGALDLSTLEE